MDIHHWFDKWTHLTFRGVVNSDVEAVKKSFDGGQMRMVRYGTETEHDIFKFFDLMGRYGSGLDALRIDKSFNTKDKNISNIPSLLTEAFDSMLRDGDGCNLRELELYEEYSNSTTRLLLLHTLTKLPKLNRLHMTVKKLYGISSALPSFVHLKTLEVDCPPNKKLYDDAEIRALCIALSDYTILPEVETMRSRLGYEVCSILDRYIKGNTSITSLTIKFVVLFGPHVNGGLVSGAGALYLMQMLRLNTGIKYLNFAISDTWGERPYTFDCKIRGSTAWWIQKYITQNIKDSLHKRTIPIIL